MKQEIDKEKLKKLEQEVQRLHPNWPQVKARWMAVRLLLPPQKQQ